jgi:hypothetical protein
MAGTERAPAGALRRKTIGIKAPSASRRTLSCRRAGSSVDPSHDRLGERCRPGVSPSRLALGATGSAGFGLDRLSTSRLFAAKRSWLAVRESIRANVEKE